MPEATETFFCYCGFSGLFVFLSIHPVFKLVVASESKSFDYFPNFQHPHCSYVMFVGELEWHVGDSQCLLHSLHHGSAVGLAIYSCCVVTDNGSHIEVVTQIFFCEDLFLRPHNKIWPRASSCNRLRGFDPGHGGRISMEAKC